MYYVLSLDKILATVVDDNMRDYCAGVSGCRFKRHCSQLLCLSRQPL